MEAPSNRGGRLVGKRDRLAQSVLRLKKAWIVAALLTGHRLTRNEGVIPDYESWTRKLLQQQAADLEEDLRMTLGVVLLRDPKKITASAVGWLAKRFNEWAATDYGLLVVSTAQEFEQKVGQLRARDVLDVPPYAQVLVQPGIEVAFRHPEYMLARDLGLLYGLFRDAEDLLSMVDWDRPPEWAAAASENALALGRATIQCCFNLLEAFTAGLARAALMTAKHLDKETAARLRNTQPSLRKRLVDIPRMLRTDKPPLDGNQPPFAILFDDIKVRRDSYVHCEPGPERSTRGYVKEDLLHDVAAPVVEKAVDATCDVIRIVWHHVHDAVQPRWLHERAEDGRFARQNLRLSADRSV